MSYQRRKRMLHFFLNVVIHFEVTDNSFLSLSEHVLDCVVSRGEGLSHYCRRFGIWKYLGYRYEKRLTGLFQFSCIGYQSSDIECPPLSTVSDTLVVAPDAIIAIARNFCRIGDGRCFYPRFQADYEK